MSDLSYIPTLSSKPESLLYIALKISGIPIRALVDSGASRSFIGPEGMKIVEDLNLKVEKNNGLVQVANSQVELVSQELVTPIELKNKVLPMRYPKILVSQARLLLQSMSSM